MTIALRKGSPYLKAMRKSVNSMKQHGQLQRLLKRDLLKEPNCNSLLAEAKALSIRKLAMLFTMLFVSLAFAAFVLTFEVFVLPPRKPRRHRGRQRKQPLGLELNKLGTDDKNALLWLLFSYEANSKFFETIWEKVR